MNGSTGPSAHAPESRARRRRPIALVALAGSALLVALAIWDVQAFLQSWIVAVLFWFCIAMGAGGVLMLHQLTGGMWGEHLQPQLRAALRTLPIFALLFVPVLLGMSSLYPWMHAEYVAEHPHVQKKAAYLDHGFFLLRTAFYFVVWIVGSRLLLHSMQENAEGVPRRPGAAKRLSAIGLVIYVLTVHFATVDWVMSLDLTWYSSIYGLLFVVAQFVLALCFALLAGERGSRTSPVGVPAKARIDVGNLLLAGVCLWAYVTFSQYLIIYYANLPEEVTWYVVRTRGLWGAIALLLIAFHFAAPFALLLARKNKTRPALMRRLALGLVVIEFLHVLWLAAPAFGERSHWHLLAHLVAATTVGAGWYLLVSLTARRNAPQEARP